MTSGCEALSVPTVIEVMDYSTIQKYLDASGKKRMTGEEIRKVAKDAEKIVGSIK